MKRFRHHDALRTFAIVAGQGSLTAAGSVLNLTKGAVSHQIRQLEDELGFTVFRRHARGIELTAKGRELHDAAATAFAGVERKITELQRTETHTVTVGLSTYLASRWLSPRLMTFMHAHPHIRLRIQPMVDLHDIEDETVDIAIRWGDGRWQDLIIEPLFLCAAFPTGAPAALEEIKRSGPQAAFGSLTLLRDRDGSKAWQHWHEIARLPFDDRAETLTIPDPNVRVQAVIDGQGIALNDALVTPELADGRLVRLSDKQLDNYGYFLAYAPGALESADVAALMNWLHLEGARQHK